MRPEGLICVDSAKADGRWSNDYAGQGEMVVPQEFLTYFKPTYRLWKSITP